MPVDPLGAAASIVQLIGTAKACLRFYDEARRNTPEAYRELRLRLEVEAVVYERWCSIVGLQDMLREVSTNPQGWQDSRTYTRFLVTLQRTLRFENRMLANLVIQVLKDLEKKFDEARKRFQPSSPLPQSALTLQSPSPVSSSSIQNPTSEENGTSNTVVGGRPKKKSMSRFSVLFHKSEKKASPYVPKGPLEADIGKRSIASLVSTAKWLSWDKRIFHQLLSDVSKLNESLLKLLDNERQVQLGRRVQIQLLGEEDFSSETPGEESPPADQDGEIKTLALVKRMNILEAQKEDSYDSETLRSTTTLSSHSGRGYRVPQFQIDDFSHGTLQFGPLRVLSTMTSSRSPVLIEWKHYIVKHRRRFEQILRLCSLVTLLNTNDIYRSFHILNCRGIIHDENKHRIGLVFDLPGTFGPSDHISQDSLQNLIRRTRKTPPPLGDRFRTAKELSVALHYLQSVHWLHKSFRSDNIVYFEAKDPSKDEQEAIQNGSSDEDQIVGTRPSSTKNLAIARRLPSFFVVGLDLSRPDHPSEVSETISLSTVGVQSRRENIVLYSHPDLFPKSNTHGNGSTGDNPGPRRIRFQAEHDIYSLGLVLLEIGIWRTLDSLQRQSIREKTDFRGDLCGKYCDELLDRMGALYWRATKRCLTNDFDFDESQDAVEDGVKKQFAFEKQVVSELEKCVA